MLDPTLNAHEVDCGHVAVLGHRSPPPRVAAGMAWSLIAMCSMPPVRLLFMLSSRVMTTSHCNGGAATRSWIIATQAPAYRPKKPAATLAPVKPPTDVDDS